MNDISTEQLLKTQNDLPIKLQGLGAFKLIVPYAFRRGYDIRVASEELDAALIDALRGVTKSDELAQIAGMKLRHHLDGEPRVFVTTDNDAIVMFILFHYRD